MWDESHRRERYGLNEHITITPNEQPPLVAIDPRLSSLYEEGTDDLVGIDRYKLEIISLLILMEQGPRASPRIKALSIEGCGHVVASASQLLQKGCTTTSEANLIVLCSCQQLLLLRGEV